MKISVALCTYNGAAYLPEQLASIAAQDCPPQELVVCDDRSTDETLAIVERFAASAPFPVRVHVNRRTLGSSENFARAVGRCRGEWIVLADQDDVWMPHKIRRLMEAVQEVPAAGLAFSDAVLVDAQRRPMPERLWRSVRFTAEEQRRVAAGSAMSVLARHNVVTGATMAFRSEHRELLLPIPAGWVHDGWFALLVAAVAPLVAVADPLIEYRQHPSQQIGAQRKGFWSRYRRVARGGRQAIEAVAAAYLAAYERLDRFRDRLSDRQALATLERKVDHFRTRLRMRDGGWRLPLAVRELFRRGYARYSHGWWSFAQDLFL